MKYILTASQMKHADNYTSEHFLVPSVVLMERAAICLRKFVLERIQKDGRRNPAISVVCGTGNNGGDGLALVRLLYEIGIEAKYFIAGNTEKFSEAAKLQYDILCAYKIKESESLEELLNCDYLLDGIFGTGLSRNLSEEYTEIIHKINGTNVCKIAIDIPSGLDATTGKVWGNAVKCDYTVTFGFRKLGHFLGEGREYTGDLYCYKMGITKDSIVNTESIVYAPEDSDLPRLLPKRRKDFHKGNYGKVLIIAGKKDMAGAAILASNAAIKTGAGLVKVYTEEFNREIMQTAVPEAMLSCYDAPSVTGESFDKKLLDKDEKWADVLLIGPGMGTGEDKKELLEYAVKNFDGPIVMDADGLTLLSKNDSLIVDKSVIITPHVGEMARLTGLSTEEINEYFLNTVKDYAKSHNITCVLKSATTVTATPDGEAYLNMYGNSGMSTGGSGDVLSGIIAGLAAQGLNNDLAAITGVLIHALAGDMAADTVGEYSVTAGKLVLSIREVLNNRI